MKSRINGLNFHNTKVYVIGDVILDEYFLGDVKRLSPEAPVPIVHVKSKTKTLGGAGNVALNLKSLGCTAKLFGIRGNDDGGKDLSDILQKNNIENFLYVDKSKPTTKKTRVIGHGQQLLRLDEEEPWEISERDSDTLYELFLKNIEEADAVILSDYNKGVLVGNLPQKIISVCRKNNIPVFVDPKRINWERYNGATGITPNLSEFEEITGVKVNNNEKLLINEANKLKRKHSIEWMVLTRGAEGICLFGENGVPSYYKATAREVFDVSGAGDTVIATLAACVASGIDFKNSTETANIAAGIVVGKIGSQPIQLRELEAELRMFELGVKGIGNGKYLSVESAEVKSKSWQANGEKVIFSYGSFDILNSGHIHLFTQAKELGNKLIIAVRNDEAITKLKGDNFPLLKEQERIDVLSALSLIDVIILFDDDKLDEIVTYLKPDFVVKASDNKTDKLGISDIVESYGGIIQLIPFLNRKIKK